MFCGIAEVFYGNDKISKEIFRYLSMNYTLNLCKPWGVMDSQDYVLLV
jgi:hypothetical protein